MIILRYTLSYEVKTVNLNFLDYLFFMRTVHSWRRLLNTSFSSKIFIIPPFSPSKRFLQTVMSCQNAYLWLSRQKKYKFLKRRETQLYKNASLWLDDALTLLFLLITFKTRSTWKEIIFEGFWLVSCIVRNIIKIINNNNKGAPCVLFYDIDLVQRIGSCT